MTTNDLDDRWSTLLSSPDAVLLDGFHALKHALRFGATVPLVVTTDPAELRRLAAELAPDLGSVEDRAPVEAVSAEALRRLVPRPHPTGVAALALRPQPVDSGDSRRTAAPYVVLENPRNLGNIGAVVRLAAGFGAAGVLTTGDVDPWHPTVVRGAAGLHFATSVARTSLQTLPVGPIFALDPDGENIHDVEFPDDALLVFGSERHGVTDDAKGMATRTVAIPMRPLVSSFNLATSVGMALFHWQGGRLSNR
ncbi:TrmH family RNA methyltransferase [Streptacidiphilus fuscans]|uniref:RNA methyltransferase n=1 Tax=Streptacidiphilus fuscans TaxID=2789292 RepID=A0A931B0T7_9ACTN|nr:RNA methyltransferase [Streptacidiphilus fuscans]MBF9068231.1 RNA methyltransferase [Streptacidiphilus fuscans]